MRRFPCLIAVLLLLFPPAAEAQPALEARLREALTPAMRPIELREEQLEGPGAEFLIETAGAAEFLAIGESHGNVQTPQLTSALLRSLRPHGYEVLALELGPVTTQLLVEQAQHGGEAAVRAVHERHPFTTGFLNWAEERELFAEAVAGGWEVWGIDQEFIGADRFLLERLLALAHNDAARAAAEAASRLAAEGFAHWSATGDSSRGFLSATTPQEFEALAAAFADGPELARQIVAELSATARVYRHYAQKRYFENNVDRVRLMKDYVAAALRASAEAGRPDPKVIFKLGSAHAGRGFSPFDQLDVGNQAAELAVLRGGESFHLYVFARAARSPDGGRRDFLEDAPYLAPLFEAAPQDRAVIFDLRPLRPLLSSPQGRAAFPELHDLARRFDAILLFPEFSPAQPLAPTP